MRALAALSTAVAAVALLGCPGRVPKEQGCLSCHTGIEQAHGSIDKHACAVCHGGNEGGVTKDQAHVPVPANWAEVRGDALPPSPVGFIKDMAPDQLDRLDPAYVRFVNPGDLRAAAAACGPCHAEHVRTMPTSAMTTNIGHYWPTLWLAGLIDEPRGGYGSYPATAEQCSDPPAGTACAVETLPPPEREEIQAAIGDDRALLDVAYRHYLAKNCNTCHQAGYPRNDSAGLYRSSGCSSCHSVYDKLGVYRGGDPTIARGTPTHAATHVVTKAIPTEQCATCHFQGGRIGLTFRGIREGGFSSARTPANAVPIEETLYGHAPGYYFTDEDSTNAIDETPPDVHFERGMHCADCHVGSDVHGDGRIYDTSKLQLDLRCEDCHGTVRQRAAPDADGVFRTSRGRALPQLSLGEGGAIVLTSIVDGMRHTAPQPADLLADGGGSAEMRRAMAPDENGWSHTDALTCDTCHTSWNLICVGCHVSLDLRLDQVDYQTGRVTPGLTRGSRTTYTIDSMLLGTGPDGRVQSVVPSQQVQLAIFGAESFGTGDGELLLGGRIDDGNGGTKVVGEFRHGQGSVANNGFVPFFQHTATNRPRTCDACHRRDASPEEEARVRGVYGHGTGEFLLPAPDGTMIDGMQFLDADGNAVTSWFHAGTGPMAPEVRARAFAVQLDQLP